MSDASDAPVTYAQEAPDVSALPSVTIYSHSNLFYWWPIWLLGFVLTVSSLIVGDQIRIDDGGTEYIHESSAPGVTFATMLLVIITFTTARLRGVYSIVAILSVAFIISLFGWAGVLDEVLAAVPDLSIHMNMGFYLFFSSLLFLLWLATFFIFDRTTYWTVRPGQMTEEHIIGDSVNSYDTRGMLFEKHSEDFFKNRILGLGSGDLRLTTSGAKKEVLTIHNVLFVDRKVEQIQSLIAVKPDDLLKDV